MKKLTNVTGTRDKQLSNVAIAKVLEKRRLHQAMNVKEFAVSAGLSYSTARSWFHLPGFPVIHGVVFWDDFVEWRRGACMTDNSVRVTPPERGDSLASLPSRAATILLDNR